MLREEAVRAASVAEQLEAQAKALEAANATLYQDKYALETEVREARESAEAERGAAAESNRQVQHTTTAATTSRLRLRDTHLRIATPQPRTTCHATGAS